MTPDPALSGAWHGGRCADLDQRRGQSGSATRSACRAASFRLCAPPGSSAPPAC